MKIKEVELNNFRIYGGTHIINILPDDEKSMVIISGKNGYGKTTFLMSLVWCLYGRLMEQVDKLYEEEIKVLGSYPKYISNSINRSASEKGENKFHVAITFIDVDLFIPIKELKIIRSYDIRTGKEELVIDGGEISELIEKMDEEKERQQFINDFILPKELAKNFFFDAEKITSFATIHTLEQKKELSKVYLEILGIKKYEDLKVKLSELLNDLKKKSATSAELVKLNDLEKELNKNKIIIDESRKSIEELNKEIDLLKHKIENLDESLIQRGKTITENELNERKQIRIKNEEKKEKLNEELSQIYDLIPFGIAGNKIKDVSKQLRIEKEYEEKKFKIENINSKVEKIIPQLQKIIAQKLEQEHNLYIPLNIKRIYEDAVLTIIKEYCHDNYDSEDNVSINFNPLLQFSRNEKNEFDNLVSNLRPLANQLKKIKNDYDDVTEELSKLEREIKEAEICLQDAEVKEIRCQKEDLSKKHDTSNQEIGKFKDRINAAEKSSIKLIKERDELLEKIKASDEQQEKVKLYETLIAQLELFIEAFQNKKKESLEQSILKNLKQLLHMDLIDKVKVEIRNESPITILLYDKHGKKINEGSLSKGQQQIYVSSILKSLVEESEINFPIFIDSPMQKLDKKHSENIIRYFYTEISDQVVIFPLLGKELTPKEFEILKPSIAKSYLIRNVNSDESLFKEATIDELLSDENQ